MDATSSRYNLLESNQQERHLFDRASKNEENIGFSVGTTIRRMGKINQQLEVEILGTERDKDCEKIGSTDAITKTRNQDGMN